MTLYQRGYMDGHKKGRNLALGYVKNPKSDEDIDKPRVVGDAILKIVSNARPYEDESGEIRISLGDFANLKSLALALVEDPGKTWDEIKEAME